MEIKIKMKENILIVLLIEKKKILTLVIQIVFYLCSTIQKMRKTEEGIKIIIIIENLN